MATSRGDFKVLAFGEAMLRYTPSNGEDGTGNPSCCASFMRSVGGDELNVLVAAAKLGYQTEYVSILPQGPLGDVVYSCGEAANVDMRRVKRSDPSTQIGTYTMLPKEKKVHYQRSNSAFAHQAPDEFDWPTILSGSVDWIHATGITPLLSESALKSWKQHLNGAVQRGIPFSLDLNWRPQLGTLEQLWEHVQPYLAHARMLVLSINSLQGIASILGVDNNLQEECASNPLDSPCWEQLLVAVDVALEPLKSSTGSQVMISCCCKERNSSGVQTRWSMVSQNGTLVTTKDVPIYHSPKDECGGGSAWSAGMLDYLCLHEGAATGIDCRKLLRRGDLLAALCQESKGDQSTTVLQDMLSYDLEARKPITVSAGIACDEIIKRMGRAGVIAIMRAKNKEVAIQRGRELADMGCKAIEVTVDSVGFEEILEALVQEIGSRCLVGVGTVMDKSQIPRIAALGAQFALSPLNPPGMIEACLEHNVLPVPAAYTPQEIYDAYLQGAKCVKLFPAQLWNPSTLKALLAVGQLGNVLIIPSGGITAANAESWLDAGAFAIGMGSKLVGGDVRCAPEDTENLTAAHDAWCSSGKAVAEEIVQRLVKRCAHTTTP